MFAGPETHGLTKYNFYQAMVGFATKHEYEAFRDSKRLSEMHMNNRVKRLMVLPAMQEAVGKVLNYHLSPDKDKRVLEVGSGSGFFQEMLAPEWLKERLVSFDINIPSLQVAQNKKSETLSLFQGNGYELGVSEESMDAVVSLSAFDSFFKLREVLYETSRCLKEGGVMLFFQDLIPELHVEVGKEISVKATDKYHRKIVSTIEQIPFLEIIAGKEDYLDAFAVESRGCVIDRLSNLEEFSESIGLENILSGELVEQVSNSHMILELLGALYHIPNGRKVSLEDGEVVSKRKILKVFHSEVKPQTDLRKIKRRRDEVIEWTRMQYLVVKKRPSKRRELLMAAMGVW